MVSEDALLEDDIDEAVPAVHTPPMEPETVPMTREEANIVDEEEPVESVSNASEQDRGAETPVVDAPVESTVSMRLRRTNAGVLDRDDQYDWNFLLAGNFSVKAGLRDRGEVADDEFDQLFFSRGVLKPLFPHERYKPGNMTRSWMFLRDKFDALGIFEKMKGRMVADGRTQDRTI